ncbi:MAG TPA: hypothetical protein VK174_01300 [Chitinophagales bacterium]|nr:hypothetical protein [Chitinophagales bacterium]
MKKIFMNLSAGTTLAVAIALTSCNNAAEVKKQVDEQNAKIQTLVDEKLNGLQDQVNAECTAKVDSLANVAYAAWLEEEAAAAKKGGKKPAVKPKPKPEPKKDETKPNTINNRPGSNENKNPGTLNNRPGSNESGKKDSTKTLNSRPGATKK